MARRTRQIIACGLAAVLLFTAGAAVGLLEPGLRALLDADLLRARGGLGKIARLLSPAETRRRLATESFLESLWSAQMERRRSEPGVALFSAYGSWSAVNRDPGIGIGSPAGDDPG
jgi:hypothetical protein